MSRRIAFPFLQISEDAIRMDGWLIGSPNQALGAATDILEDWDYARDLQVAGIVHFDWAAISGSLEIPVEDIRLRVALVAGTGVGTLPRQQWRACEFKVDGSTSQLDLSAIIPGRILSGRLQLKVLITLDAPLEAGSELSPRTLGARLWDSIHDILIEDGGDSRFPVELLSFGQAFRNRPQEAAPWFLHWQPGHMHLDFSASVRLYVSSAIPETSARFVAGDAPTLQAMMADVISQVLTSVLDSDDEADLLAYDEGSIGRQVHRWFEVSFPGSDRATIKALKDLDPGAFRAAILASSEIGESL